MNGCVTCWAFCDLADSTALSSRLDPEDLREVMARYYQVASETLKEHGGYVAKFLGDGLLVYFGWPTAHEDDAERAIRGGIAAAEAIAQLTTSAGSLSVRVGIATGPAVVGDILHAAGTQERRTASPRSGPSTTLSRSRRSASSARFRVGRSVTITGVVIANGPSQLHP